MPRIEDSSDTELLMAAITLLLTNAASTSTDTDFQLASVALSRRLMDRTKVLRQRREDGQH